MLRARVKCGKTTRRVPLVLVDSHPGRIICSFASRMGVRILSTHSASAEFHLIFPQKRVGGRRQETRPFSKEIVILSDMPQIAIEWNTLFL